MNKARPELGSDQGGWKAWDVGARRAVQLAGMRSLRAVYGRCAVVLVVARIRDVLDVKADPAQPDRWVPELALLALRANAGVVREAPTGERSGGTWEVEKLWIASALTPQRR